MQLVLIPPILIRTLRLREVRRLIQDHRVNVRSCASDFRSFYRSTLYTTKL